MLVTECKRRMVRFLKATQRSRGSWRTDVCIPCRRAGRISHRPRSTQSGSSHPQISGLTQKRSVYTLLHRLIICYMYFSNSIILVYLSKLIGYCSSTSYPAHPLLESCLASPTKLMIKIPTKLEL